MKRAPLPCGRPAPAVHSPPDEPRLLRWRNRLKEYLAAHGGKFSEQRWKIARHILEARRHWNAGDIVREVQRAYPEIGAATVYRNLKVLSEAKLLRETLVDAEGRVVYEVFDDEHHDHIVCVDCGVIFEFHDAAIETRQEKVADAMKFQPVSHRHVIYAHCAYKKR